MASLLAMAVDQAPAMPGRDAGPAGSLKTGTACANVCEPFIPAISTQNRTSPEFRAWIRKKGL
ncbi:hypothetical protein KVG96_06775 [Pseudomonas sp. COR58]|uniref:Uncharacterized protein n=1 Tax=Pseudomonas ekonensis TaxID=2842353 RepID=A0ABS6PB14_9PSED|nr:hypothetical protein [Pseudomonas ekonensis]MBV4457647.1 hypothetical protein [Pseudomonas ekonensis]